LGVASQGRTKTVAVKNLKEAVELYLEEDHIGIPQKIELIGQ
jgi:predicted RNase H-like HicB family nuclease